mgnify:FL=1
MLLQLIHLKSNVTYLDFVLLDLGFAKRSYNGFLYFWNMNIDSDSIYSLQRRTNFKELDNEALAFQPVLGSMLAAIYHNPQNKETNQMRLQKIVQFWGAKEVYSKEIISAFENEMIAGPPTGYRMPALHARGPQMEKSLHLSANIPGVLLCHI